MKQKFKIRGVGIRVFKKVWKYPLSECWQPNQKYEKKNVKEEDRADFNLEE